MTEPDPRPRASLRRTERRSGIATHSVRATSAACAALATLTACEASRPVRPRVAAWSQREASPTSTSTSTADAGLRARVLGFAEMESARSGARVLKLNDVTSGHVSYQDGKKTDWFRIDPHATGLLHLDLDAAVGATGLEVTLVEETGERPLGEHETLEMFDPRAVYVRVTANEPLAQGAYRLSLTETETPQLALTGQVLRYNGKEVTLDLGGEDGMKPGLRGFIERTDKSRVPFKVTRVLRRTSRVETGVNLGLQDVGSRALVKQERAANPVNAR